MKSRSIILIAIAAAVCVALGGVALTVAIIDRGFSEGDRTQRDFKNDAQRIAFIQDFLPVTVPAGASAIQIKYDRWQDYHLEASFQLSAADMAAFAKALQAQAAAPRLVAAKMTTASAPAVTSNPDGSYHFVTRDGYDTGTIRIDSVKGAVSIECFSL
ncbi:MAG: hypothetical protein ACE15C_15070 [Phycisphaerae bacterium]